MTDDLALTPQERDLILKQREARKINTAGAYGPAPKLGPQEASLLAQMDALNQNRLTAGYGPLPRDIDAATLETVKRVQQIGHSMKNQFGDLQPFVIPTRIAYEVVRAMRGNRS